MRPRHTTVLFALCTVAVGCAARSQSDPVSSSSVPAPPVASRPATSAVEPAADPDLLATPAPPSGWKPTPPPPSNDKRHIEKLWTSPSGQVAYGIVKFSMPFHVPASLVINGYVDEIRHAEGSAELLHTLPDTGGATPFAVRGAKSTIDLRLTRKDTTGWFVYVRTSSLKPPPAGNSELNQAISAMEKTRVGNLP